MTGDFDGRLVRFPWCVPSRSSWRTGWCAAPRHAVPCVGRRASPTASGFGCRCFAFALDRLDQRFVTQLDQAALGAQAHEGIATWESYCPVRRQLIGMRLPSATSQCRFRPRQYWRCPLQLSLTPMLHSRAVRRASAAGSSFAGAAAELRVHGPGSVCAALFWRRVCERASSGGETLLALSLSPGRCSRASMAV